jgi:hypothetical protein
MQLRAPGTSLYVTDSDMCDEFVMRFQPGEAIYSKIVVKRPGLDAAVEMSELDLSYSDRYQVRQLALLAVLQPLYAMLVPVQLLELRNIMPKSVQTPWPARGHGDE